MKVDRDVSDRMRDLLADPRPLSRFAESMTTSEILTIAYQVRERIQAGEDILNLTVGDFSSTEFPIPDMLAAELTSAVRDGETNYPPAPGVVGCRRAVQDHYRTRLGLSYPLESILMCSGARPAIFGAFASVVDREDRVVFGLPSWNNDHYTRVVGGTAVAVETDEASRFFIGPDTIAPHLSSARLVCLNSPQNPTGTVIREHDLRGICELILEENRRRRGTGERPLYLLYDQVYWTLTFDGATHQTPVALFPEMADYTFFADGISKGYAATGLRVGWCVGPADVMRKMVPILAHVGAWAPRAEQVATGRLLGREDVLADYTSRMRTAVRDRLARIAEGVQHHRARGWPVDCIAPQGAIYLSIKLDLAGWTTRAGQRLETTEDVRNHILEHAGIALVPFRAFGFETELPWFRASVGVASLADCESVQARLQRAFDLLESPA